MFRGAQISNEGNYRYRLWRRWDETKPYVGFLMLNPSTADARCDDRTIRKCIRFAQSWGFGGIEVCNLFAWRAQNPSEIKHVADPIGDRNDAAIEVLFAKVPMVVAAWGNDGNYLERSAIVAKKYAGRLHILKLNKSGEPSHPLFLPGDTEPIPWA